MPSTLPAPIDKLAIVVVTYKRQELLANLFDSMTELTAAPWRIVIVDNENSRETEAMCAAFNERLANLWGIDTEQPDALEKLVSAAEGCNADFAKANFDFYWSKPEERRSLHEMFKPKDCGKPVHPSDTTQFFKQKPSIWSAVYRRDFLERNGIKFLPTPGASFQDTSFAFKVIACADKAVYLHDAVLSYRQDNENSSVNSSAKVFCVNAEYAEIERWIREDYARNHASDDVARMLKFNQLIKYDSYMWNYVRLAPKFYKEFLVQMTKEFQASLDAGDFSLDDLKPWKRANLAAILKDPEAWEDEHPHFATDGALGRAKYYASVGGPGVVAAFLIESLRG